MRRAQAGTAASPSLGEVEERLGRLRARIASAGRDPSSVTVLAVTKGFGLEAVRCALGAGLAELGENYAAELQGKARGAESEGLAARWHFLGAIQRNKVRGLAPLVDLWQGVSRAVEGEEIARWAPGARVLVQVDFTGAAGRGGCGPEAVPGLVRSLRGLGLEVEGLMTVGPRGLEQARAAFRDLARLGGRLDLAELSMGMTEDLEAAVKEGATIVRVGRGLFGPRPSKERLRQ